MRLTEFIDELKSVLDGASTSDIKVYFATAHSSYLECLSIYQSTDKDAVFVDVGSADEEEG